MTRCKSLLLVASAASLAATPLMASAQQTQPRRPRSTMRIPIGKDRTVAAERAETTAAAPARCDTVRLPGRVDTVTVTRNVTDTVTVTRIDTVEQQIHIRQAGGFYAGIAGGADFPEPNFSDGSLPGWHVEVPLGYDPVGSPVGLRVAAGYSSHTPHDWVANQLGNAQTMNGDADLKLRLVSLTPAEERVQVYGIGGVSYVRFRDVLENSPNGWVVGNNGPSMTAVPAADSTWHTGMGWNAGAGFEVGKGRTNFFVEARFVRFKGVATNVSSTPIIAGFTWY